MFGISFGELLLVILVVFLVSPRDLPRFMKKIGEFIATGDRLRKEISNIHNEIVSIAKSLEIEDQIPVKKKQKMSLDNEKKDPLEGKKESLPSKKDRKETSLYKEKP
jgi:Sec-independent protein translocase protein TatA